MKDDLIAIGLKLMDRSIAITDNESPEFDKALIMAQNYYDENFAGKETLQQFCLTISALLFIAGLSHGEKN